MTTAPQVPQMDPAMLFLVGGLGKGKSTENVYSWAGCGLFLAQPGALRVAESTVGFSVADRTMKVSTLSEVVAIMPSARSAGYGAVVIDDVSLLMGNELEMLRERYGQRVTDKNVSKYAGRVIGDIIGVDRQMWTDAKSIVTTLGRTARHLGLHVVLNGHLQESYKDEDTGQMVPAGPDMGWKRVVKTIPALADGLYNVVDPPLGAAPWDTRCAVDLTNSMLLAKDRFNAIHSKSGPLNTAEVLRAAGFSIPRPRGLEFLEGVAEHVAGQLAGGALDHNGYLPNEKAVTTPMMNHLLSQKVPEWAIRWGLRDGVHRARIRAFKSGSTLAGF